MCSLMDWIVASIRFVNRSASALVYFVDEVSM